MFWKKIPNWTIKGNRSLATNTTSSTTSLLLWLSIHPIHLILILFLFLCTFIRLEPGCLVLFSALSIFQAARSYASSIWANITKQLGLTWSTDQQFQFLTALPSMCLLMLDVVYLTKAEWWYKTMAMRNQWYGHLMHDKQLDKRLPCHAFCRVDPSYLQWIVDANESVVVHNADTRKLVMMVL